MFRKCNPRKVSAYVDGELGPTDRSSVEGHLAACNPCAKAASEFEGLDRMALGDPVPEVSGAEWNEVLSRVLARASIDDGTDAVRHPARAQAADVFSVLRGRRRGWAIGLAAAAAVILGLFVLPGLLRSPEGKPPAETAGKEAPAKTEDYAEHLQGPQPEIRVDPADGATHLKYPEF